MTHTFSNLTDLESSERLENTLTELNERIARLAMSLGADIDSSAAVFRILNREVPALQHLLTEAADAHGLHTSSHYRLHRDWEELRGLLALRCDILTDTLNDKGLQVTTQIASNVEHRLTRDGFKQGADGFDLFDSLNEIDSKKQ
jgi:hypothetical protein